MGAAAYQRGSRAISEQINRDFACGRTVLQDCRGKMYNDYAKRFARCARCGRIDWEKNEGDMCTRQIEIAYAR